MAPLTRRPPHRLAWADLTPARRAALVVVGTVETALTLAAWADLARRPASAVRGPKAAWALGALVQPVGPIAYFVRGRRPVGASPTRDGVNHLIGTSARQA